MCTICIWVILLIGMQQQSCVPKLPINGTSSHTFLKVVFHMFKWAMVVSFILWWQLLLLVVLCISIALLNSFHTAQYFHGEYMHIVWRCADDMYVW